MFAQANGIRIHYEQQGDGAELVLLPGLGMTTNVWYAQLRALSPLLRVTAVDPRGHGRSDKPPGPYSLRLLADDVAALLEGAGLGPAVVAGSSMASQVALELAAAHPERVRALVLVGGFASLPPAGRERMTRRAETAEAQGMEPLVDLVVAGALGAHSHARQPALVGLYRDLLLRNDPRAYAACCRAIAAADSTPLLPRVACPTLILFGEEEQVAPLSAARALKAGIPHAELRVIPRAGHLPFMEQSALFNAALQEFIAGLPG